MCTVVVLHRPGHDWPLILAANRDERLDRLWDPPAPHWPGRPGVIAGRDRTGGGSWMGINRLGVAAAVLNRPGSLGPAAGKRSRGILPLLALDHTTAAAAAETVAGLDAGQFRTFNMVIADLRGAFFLRGSGSAHPQLLPLPAGLHMVTALDPDDLSSRRVARHLPRFRTACPPDPSAGDWAAWRDILADASGPPGSEINVPASGGFGTVCASLLALPAAGQPVWRFAAGPPDQVPFQPVSLSFAATEA